MTEHPNIAIVVLDTLRKDAFDEHFDWLPGRRFENAWSPSHWTVPVHGSLFSGKYATETGVHAKSSGFDYSGTALAEQLSSESYTTRAYSSNVNITPQQNFDRGFDEFTGSWRLDAVGEDYFGWGEFSAESERSGLSMYAAGVVSCIFSDAKTFPSLKNGVITKFRDLDLDGALIDDGAKRAKQWITETDFGNQEFLFVNLMEAHSPYLPPRGYRTTQRVDVDSIRSYMDEPDVSEETARQAYDDSVRYLSDIYCDIYESLSDSFDYIITLSDHGELLGEHGAWDHLYGVYPELTHVPLIVDGPGLSGTSDEVVSLLDVHATVLDIANVSGESRGASLLSERDAIPRLTEYHGLSPTVKESLQSEGYDTTKFETELRGIAVEDNVYGYQTADGFECIPETADAKALQEGISEIVENLDHRHVSETGVDDDLQSQLEALGYA
ncbi:sulfatase-like hydrolase/transferase [Haloparvum sp. PAK95]|uniref:sulfatase-like hydrolase/transferase n=1 Tax=Haloparvum sp. PAK95 TaxID=3418962 RepID=UPI003D2ECC40